MTYLEWDDFNFQAPLRWSWDIVPERSIRTYLYFIQQENGPIKIGVSRTPHRRLKTLQTGNAHKLTILGLCKGTKQDEQQIHRIFSELRISGEWFEPSLALMAFIEEIKK